jgi:hypothetical protein
MDHLGKGECEPLFPVSNFELQWVLSYEERLLFHV